MPQSGSWKDIDLKSYLLAIALIASSVLLVLAPEIESYIPPTPSFKFINTTTGNVTAVFYDDFVEFVAGSGITISPNFATNEITFTATGGNVTSPNELYCILGEWFSSFNATTGNFDCTRVPVYENNTASNLSPGTGLFTSKSGVDLPFKSLAGGSGITLSNNATTVLITATGGSGENTTAVNLGTSGHGVFESEVSDQLRFKKIACTGLTCTNNSTNITLTVSAGSGNMTVLGDAGDSTITSPASLSILQYVGSQWIDKIFSINTQTATNGNFITGINNSTGAITTQTFKVFTTTCGGTDKVSAINNSTGTVTCTTDATGAGGSGIPLPPKKWGELIPRSASVDTIGLVAGCSILATATYVYDASDESNAILSTTAVTDGINGGIHCSGANYNSFRGDHNVYMYSKVEWNKITTNRVFVGFQSSSTHLPNNADTILDNLSGYGICVRTSDTLIQECRNDGDATTDYASTGVTETAGVVYAIEVYAKSDGTSWCYKINGSAESCQTTEIPATTTRLYPNSTGETDGGATAILWTQYLWYLQSDK